MAELITSPHGIDVAVDGGWRTVKFAATRLRIAVELLPGSTTDAKPVAPGAALGLLGNVDAACDGPLFGWGANTPHDYDKYESGKVETLQLDRRSNLAIASSVPDKGYTVSVSSSGELSEADGGRAPGPNAVVALQTYPQLVRARANVHTPGRDPQRVWRPAFVVWPDGRVGFAIGVGSMDDLARFCLRAGAVSAGALDGGGSAHLLVRGGGSWGHRENRRVPSWVCCGRESSLPALPAAVASVPTTAIVGACVLAAGIVAVAVAIGGAART